MPIYEYRCQDCGTRFEKLVRGQADESELACPACGRKRLGLELSVFSAPRSAPSRSSSGPMCPAGGPCPTPGACGLQ